MEKENRVYHSGKGIKNDDRRTPFVGEPNTNLDTREKRSGKLTQRRKFGPDGKAKVDYDVAHKSHRDYDHGHDIVGKERKEARPLTKKEKREIEKAKKKRKVWK